VYHRALTKAEVQTVYDSGRWASSGCELVPHP
jgi:hypothetical protein